MRELADMPRYRFVAHEKISSATRTRLVPVTYDLVLHGGERLRIRWTTDSDEVGDGWEALAQLLSVLTPTDPPPGSRAPEQTTA